jgi:hypothetical protein
MLAEMFMIWLEALRRQQTTTTTTTPSSSIFVPFSRCDAALFKNSTGRR